MRIAVLTFTKHGRETGIKISKVLEEHKSDLFAGSGFSNKGIKKIERPLKKFVGELFRKYQAIIFVSALGIAVRTISGHLKDKRTDPAVVVVDEKGRFAISLLSGHLGGANDLAVSVARRIGAQAIITTATDLQGKTCVESIAKKFNLEIENYEGVKRINATIVNEGKVCVFSDVDLNLNFSKNISYHKLKEMGQVNCDASIIITNKIVRDFQIPHVILRPKNLIVGIGAKKDIGKKRALKAINRAFENAGLSIKSIKAVATIDFKARENGILEACKELGVPLKVIASKKVKEIQGDFDASPIVLKKVGLRAVCEPVAILAGKKANLVQKKVKEKGVAIAIAEEGN